MEERTLYDLIVDSIDDKGNLPEGFHLPAEDEDKAMFADGALDGIFLYHMGGSPLAEEDVEKIGSYLKMAAAGDMDEAEAAFMEFCKEHRALSIIDELQQYIIHHTEELDPENMYEFAVNMMVGSKYIECVKVGMSILELFDTEENDDVAEAVKTIGLSDEFTLFSVFLMRGWEEGAYEIMDLASHVRGWGRIHCVDYLEPEDDEIREWILENGVDNQVVPAYSAMNAFEKADVAGLLEKADLSKKEMQCILKIVSAMLDEGPVSGISNLDAPEEFLALVLSKAETFDLSEAADKDILTEIENWLAENK